MLRVKNRALPEWQHPNLPKVSIAENLLGAFTPVAQIRSTIISAYIVGRAKGIIGDDRHRMSVGAHHVSFKADIHHLISSHQICRVENHRIFRNDIALKQKSQLSTAPKENEIKKEENGENVNNSSGNNIMNSTGGNKLAEIKEETSFNLSDNTD